MPDRRVTTWKSKQVAFVKTALLDDTLGEDDDYIICISPASVWLLRTMLAFYGYFYNRWLGFTRSEIDQLVAETEVSLVSVLGCETDLKRLADALESMDTKAIDQNLFLQELVAMNTHLANLSDTLVSIGGSSNLVPFLDDVEDVLDDIGTILGIAGAVIG